MQKKVFLYLIISLFLVSLVFAAHTTTVSINPASSYETLKKAYNITLINDGTSNDSINNVTISLNGFTLNEVKSIPNWVYTVNGNSVTFLTSIASIAPGFGGPFKFNATANIIGNDTTYNFNIVTQDTVNATYAGAVSVGILNDVNAPQVSNITPINGTFVKNTGILFSLNYLEQETSFNNAQILYNYDNIYQTNPWPYNGLKQMNCADNYCSIFFDFSDNTLNNKYLTSMLNVSDIVGNINTAKVYIVIDSDLPQINLLVPPYNTITNYVGDGNFQFNASDESFNNVCAGSCVGKLFPELNCSLYVDSNYINKTTVTNTSENYDIWANITQFQDGPHYWNIICQDKAGWLNTSNTSMFTIDRTPPEITLVSPSNNSIIASGTIITLDVNDTYAGVNSVWYDADNGFSDVLAIPYEIDTTGWPEGVTQVTVSADDTLTNLASKTFTFTIDDTSPTIDLLSLLPDGYLTGSPTTIPFSVTDNFLQNLTCTLSIDSQNPTIITNGSTDYAFQNIALQNGTYPWTITCTDQAGNSDTTLPLNLNIDAIAPNVTLVSPWDGASIQNGFVDFNYTVYEVNDISNCSLYLNNQRDLTNTTGIIKDGSTINNLSKTLSQGTYTWFVSCYDIYGNQGNSTNGSTPWTLFYDTTPPVISNINSSATDTTATVNWLTDEFSTNIINYGANCSSLSNLLQNNTLVNGLHSIVLTSLTASSSYSYVVSGSDQFGNNAANSSCNNFTTLASLGLPSGPGPSGGGGGGGGGSGGPYCYPNWTVSEWSQCSINGLQTRTVTDKSNCNVTTARPSGIQTCTYLECAIDEDCLTGYECKDNKCVEIANVTEALPGTGFAILDLFKGKIGQAGLAVVVLGILIGLYSWYKNYRRRPKYVDAEQLKETLKTGKIK